MRSRPWRKALAFVAVLAAQSGAAVAQPISSPGQDDLFSRYIYQPSAPQTALDYATATGRAGDIEAAIGALERLIFFSPNTARLRFEVAKLYYRLGSYEMARGYFRSALRCPDVTPAMQAEAEEFIATADRRTRPDQASGFFQTGLRYQTNASLGASVQPGQFDPRLFAQGDWNWFSTLGFNYVHDFGNQRGDVFEASLIAYDAQQFRLNEFDVAYAEARIGPRFGILLDTLDGASFKPYVIANGALLGDGPYLASGGGGATVHLNLGPVALDPYAEVVYRSFTSSSFYPRAGGLTGTLATVALPVTGTIYGGLAWQVRASYSRSNDLYSPFAYDRGAVDVAFPWTFPSPWDGRAVVVTPSFGYGVWSYRQPDIAVDPFTTERDVDWHVGLGVDVPVVQQIRLGAQALYREIRSNIPIYSVRDFSVTVGPSVRF